MASKELVPAGGAQANFEDIAGPVMILRYSQLELAKFLEICYLQLKEHPVQAGQVRATANEARMQHNMSSGLMKLFMVTAEFVAKELMPMMKKVIKKRKSKIIMDILKNVLEKAEEMKAEAEKVRDRYEQLRAKLQTNISDVNKRNKEVETKQRVLSVEKQEVETLARQSEKEQREMEEERRRKLDEIKKMQKQRDELLASAVPSDADDQTWSELMQMSVPSVTSKLDVLQAGMEFAKVPLHLIRQGMKTYGAIKGGQQAQAAIDKEDEQQNKLREQIRERQETTQKRLTQIKRIDLKSASLGDIKSLMEALRQLGKADEMFGEIILFWDNMTVFLKSLHNKTGAGKSFLKAIKTKKYANMFEVTITKAEKEWRKFGSICRAYAMQTDDDVKLVYDFLSKPVDLMDIPQRERRIKELTSEMEKEAKQLEY